LGSTTRPSYQSLHKLCTGLVRQDHDRLRCKPAEYVEADETGFTKLSHSNGSMGSGNAAQ
jgi:hypothetical protein